MSFEQALMMADAQTRPLGQQQYIKKMLLQEDGQSARVRILSAINEAEQEERNLPHVGEYGPCHAVRRLSYSGKIFTMDYPCDQSSDCPECKAGNARTTNFLRFYVYVKYFEFPHEPMRMKAYQYGSGWRCDIDSVNFITTEHVEVLRQLGQFREAYQTLTDREYVITRNGPRQGNFSLKLQPCDPTPYPKSLSAWKLELPAISDLLIQQADESPLA